jgi:hypothetical protein
MPVESFLNWCEALEQRHLKNLTFSEVRHGVQALSSLYVSRRERVKRESALDGAGKRAAFAIYFAPLHFLLVREIVRALGVSIPSGLNLVDLGCGTGSAGAAWARESDPAPKVLAVDRNSWALQECKWTFQQLGIHGTTNSADLERFQIPHRAAVLAAFTMNELGISVRGRFRKQFLDTAENGAPVLIIEPIAGRLNLWWDEWARDWKKAGGREDEWRFRLDLPERLALMDKAAGLDHRELTGRSLWLPGRLE